MVNFKKTIDKAEKKKYNDNRKRQGPYGYALSIANFYNSRPSAI